MKGSIAIGALWAATTIALSTTSADDQKTDASLFANAGLKALMQAVQAEASRFEHKLDAALFAAKLRGSPVGEWMNMWAEDLEDELDDMAEAFFERDSAEFNERFENSMLMATALNRAMLRNDLSDAAETEWRSLRSDLSRVALMMKRPVLPDVGVAKLTTLPSHVLSKADIRQVMDQLDASTNGFKDKAQNSWFANIAGEKQRRFFKWWVDALEERSEQMLDAVKAKDADQLQQRLEQTLLLAAGVNRMVLASATSSIPVAEWNVVRQQLNTLGQAFGYPVLADRVQMGHSPFPR